MRLHVLVRLGGVVLLSGVLGMPLGSSWQEKREAQNEKEEAKRRQKELEEKVCGPEGVEHWAESDKKQHPTPEAPPDKALIYVIRPSSMGARFYQSKVAVDGQWVGVNTNNTYLFFTLEPGEHHFCSQMKPMGKGLVILRVQAGKTYYFFVQQNASGGWKGRTELVLTSESRAQQALKKAHLSVFREKK